MWNPFAWSSANVINFSRDLVGSVGLRRPDRGQDGGLRGDRLLLCLLIAYPAAYFVARFAGRRKGLFLVLLIAPFWISYMMRMLAWISLLQTNGFVNKALS